MKHYTVLVSDYDNTLAQAGEVNQRALDALHRWHADGRRLILATGRHLPDLRRVFPALDLCDAVVAENGALLYLPASQTERLLGSPPPAALVARLREHGVKPLLVGQGVIGTLKPHDTTAQQVIAQLGLDWQVMLNKQDVMLLAPGINKASGLRAALEALGLASADSVGIGDAENDYDLFDVCASSAVVANALPALKPRVDYVAQGAYGDGVAELIDRLLASAPDK